jgi:3-oxoacyl-[acyl-carrier-protein] synthase II
MRRVAVTGIGVCSPLGNDPAALIEAGIGGRSAIRPLQAPWASRLAAPLAAQVSFAPEQHFEPTRARMLDRVSQLAVVAARGARSDAQLAIEEQQRSRAGVFIGTGMGGALACDEGYRTLYGERSDHINPFTVLLTMNNAAAAWIALEYRIVGPTLTYSTACSSSTVAIGEAWSRIAAGDLDVALAGGAEAPLSLGCLKAWEALRALARPDPSDPATSCKPFAADRSGLVLGEGAAVLVLEEWTRATRRGARLHGELAGYAAATDLAHITRPSVDGQASAMRAALESAHCAPGDIDTINAHGTGTLANDAVETAAIKTVFGARAREIPISATKAIHGHLLGASGALELALALLAMQREVLLPTMHLTHPAADCDLDYVPNRARLGVRTRTVMSNSFAFGGTNAVLIARAA